MASELVPRAQSSRVRLEQFRICSIALAGAIGPKPPFDLRYGSRREMSESGRSRNLRYAAGHHVWRSGLVSVDLAVGSPDFGMRDLTARPAGSAAVTAGCLSHV